MEVVHQKIATVLQQLSSFSEKKVN